MSFLETPRFPEGISYGATGGPEYQTDVVLVNSGHEHRNGNWNDSRGRYDVGYRMRTKSQTAELTAFFRAIKGRLNGFRFKDWSDYEVSQANGVLTKVSNGVYQLGKEYEAGSLNEIRKISKPLAGLTIYRNDLPVTEGSGAGEYALDTTTGRVTFVADITRTITGITKAASGVVTTSVAHGLTNGQTVELSGIGGMTQLNGMNVAVTSLTSTTFSISVDTSSFTTYTSGGSVKKFIQASETLGWAGEFDVPCRFDTDRMQIEIVSEDNYSWGSIPVIEIRV